MTKIKKIRGLLKCVSLLSSANVWGNPGREYFWGLIKYCHKKGWLYVGMDGEDVDSCVITYRVKDEHSITDDLPETDEGNCLYVLAAVSKSRDKNKLTKLKSFILSNYPDVNRVILHHRGNENDLRIFEVNRETKET